MKPEDKALKCRAHIQNHIDFDFYKTLFDPVRIEILIYLLANGTENIKEISENFSQDRSVISRHLDLMLRCGIVEKRKENRNIYYKARSRIVIEKFEETSVNIKKLMTLATSYESEERA